MKTIRQFVIVFFLALLGFVFVACDQSVSSTTTTFIEETSDGMPTTVNEVEILKEKLGLLQATLEDHHGFTCDGDICTFVGGTGSGIIKLTFDFDVLTYRGEWFELKTDASGNDYYIPYETIIIDLISHDIAYSLFLNTDNSLDSDYCVGNYLDGTWSGYSSTCNEYDLSSIYDSFLNNYLSTLLDSVDLTVNDFK